MDEKRIVEIESKVAHQELLLEELNAVLTDQQMRIGKLEARSERLAERLEALGEPGAAATTDEPPPHY